MRHSWPDGTRSGKEIFESALRSSHQSSDRSAASEDKEVFGWAMLFNSHHDCGECCRLVAKLLSATTEVVSFQRYATACSKAGLLVPPAREQCYRDATTDYNTALREIRRHRSSHGQPFTPRAKAIPFLSRSIANRCPPMLQITR